MAARAPKVQYIQSEADLGRIDFHDDLAAVEVPIGLVDALPLKNWQRTPEPRLDRVMRSIRARGYVPTDPVICRIGMKGRWVVADGGHRLTAARKVAGEFWTNLCRPKVRTIYFLLFTTPGSWSKVASIAADMKATSPFLTVPVPERADLGEAGD